MAKADKISGIRGMEDILPAEAVFFTEIEQAARKICAYYNFGEIRTPIVEPASLFERGVGESNDVVNKEMYTFLDRKEKKLALRPEGTASVARAYVNNSLQVQESISRLFYCGPMFRYERPQKGRKRQFYQLGVEVFGSSSPYADVEVMALTHRLFEVLGLKGIQLEINSLGNLASRKKYNEVLKEFLQKNTQEIPEKFQEKIELNPLRLFDVKDDQVQALMKNAPTILTSLDETSLTYFEKVKQGLEKAGVPFNVNERIVRGLDYYTQTIFEFVTQDLGAQNAVAAGGRYDGLVVQLGGADVPGVGVALGIDRVVLLLQEQQTKQKECDFIFIAATSDAACVEAAKIAESLRAQGQVVSWDYEAKSLKSQLKKADKIGASKVIIIGDDEVQDGKAIVRNMQTKEQKEVSLSELCSHCERM